MHGGCRAITAVIALAGLTACHDGEPSLAYPGVSEQPRVAGALPPQKHRPPKRWDALEEVQHWPSVTTKPFVSAGHGLGRYLADVRIDPDYRATYAKWVRGAELPAGATVAQLLRNRADGSPGPIYAMHKRAAGRWEFTVADSKGNLVDDVPLGLCARCHADAVSDSLFGVPHAPLPGANKTTVEPPTD